MNRINYWKESLASSLEEHGVTATEEQLALIATDINTSYECMDMAFGRLPDVHPLQAEVNALKKKLKEEQSMVICRECNGRGYTVSVGPSHISEHRCWRCDGRGRHL